MRRPYSLPLVASFTVVVLLLASCGDTADDSTDTTIAATTTTASSTETTEAPVTTTTSAATVSTAPAATAPTNSQDVLLMFDGTAVTYRGPETLEAGDVTFTLENTSEEEAVFAWGMVIDDSITLEDEIAWMEAHPDYEIPPWLGTWADIGWVEPGEVVEKTTYMFEGRAELTAWNDATGVGYVAAFIDVTGN